MKRFVIGALVLVVGAFVGTVLGQVSGPSTAIATAAVVQELTLNVSTVDFGTLQLLDFIAGSKEVTPAQELNIRSNVNWTLTVKADTATWTGPWTKPTGDLVWKASVVNQPPKFTQISTTYAGLSTTSAIVAKGLSGNNIKLNGHFKMLLSFDNDLPGNYQLGFTYTLTTP